VVFNFNLKIIIGKKLGDSKSELEIQLGPQSSRKIGLKPSQSSDIQKKFLIIIVNLIVL